MPLATDARSRYTGTHVIGYELGSLEAGSPVFNDFGAVRPRYTNYAGVAVDPQGRWLYHTASPFHTPDLATEGLRLYRTDLATGIECIDDAVRGFG